MARQLSPHAARARAVTAALEATAFQNPDCSIAVVILNRGEEQKTASVAMPDGEACLISIRAHEIVSVSLM